jgi:hypothetical protein
VTFLDWTRLHATWIKPEVVATKKYTGYLHYRFITTGSRFLWSPYCSYMWFFFSSCGQLFVRLWYCVSDVLDLSLVSKRFGFWPHVTHVIVLTFKEIKNLSDYRTVGPSDCRTIGLSDYRSDPKIQGPCALYISCEPLARVHMRCTMLVAILRVHRFTPKHHKKRIRHE